MTRKEEQKAWQAIGLGYYDDDKERLLNDAKAAWSDQRDKEPSVYRLILNLAKIGGFAIGYYYIKNDMISVYGDGFDESRYLNKDGSLKYRDGECYAERIYAHKLAISLEKLYA